MSIELQSSIVSQNATPQPPRPNAGDDVSRASQALARSANSASLAPQSETDVDGGRQITEVAQKAAESMFKGREVEVRGFHDDSSGRFVYRISDKSSGQVLAQTPPDALLRFYASYEGAGKPLVSVDA